MSGFDLLRTLKAESSLADVPVIFITSHSEAGFEVSALDMGAADFIAKPLKSSRVLARVRTQLRVKHMADELRRTATTDGLTGVANRRQFDVSLESEWRRAQRSGEPVSLLMIDVDHFKLYNDLYGHPQGDICLCRVTQALRSTCGRPADLVARYGGEEFMILLPQTPREGANHMAQRQVLDAVTALRHISREFPNHTLRKRKRRYPVASTMPVRVGHLRCTGPAPLTWSRRQIRLCTQPNRPAEHGLCCGTLRMCS